MSDHSSFAGKLLHWFDVHGRHDLPWQIKNDPYKVWVSEIMLQQTQVKTVLQYYDRFITRFPTVTALAQASWDEVAPYWAGLGYYARARNLHKASQQVVEQGDFPKDLEGWIGLSGIGRSTAGAMMSLGLGQFGVILDGNVKRVLSRYFAISGDLSKPAKDKELWQLATELVPQDRHADYTQAIMDLGATICTPKKPLCLYCPMQEDCQAYQQNNVLAYPEKKAKKTVPTRQGHVMIFEHAAQWLWLKRPNQGLWGGLYSLPIIEDEQELIHFLDKWQLQESGQSQVQHQFTHFTWQLKCHKFSVDAATSTQLAAYFQAMPYLTEQIQQGAIPTAMQKVIAQF
ncbi:A/G-specific adenine glycosylase [Acinetobacter puyangensis]|uniref:A/G-specific adenine glycosylase n=1 Tax=Acinetobacter puyangensis TaxID=1096779 RepID=UPI003A4DCF53